MADIIAAPSPSFGGDTSESAYLIDLLNWLKTCPCRSSAVKGAKELTQDAPPNNLFDVLTARRPDLKIAVLSTDSTMKIPYVAIINELLESFIASRYGTNISDATFPFNFLPHNSSSYAIRAYLKTMKTSYEDVVSTFRFETRIVAAIQDDIASLSHKNTDNPVFSQPALSSGTTAVWEGALATAKLGLQGLDVAAITRETIYPREFLDLAMKIWPNKLIEGEQTSLKQPEIPTAWSNWGYSSMEAMVDTDESRATGLCFVKSQFLPRSSMSFTELLELTKSTWFHDRLVIDDGSESGGFVSQLSLLRLRAVGEGKEPDSSATGPLTVQLCHDLQAFIRLKIRLGWSVDQLDAALDGIRENHMALDSKKTLTKSISLGALCDLSRIITLSRLVHRPLDSLLPLWTEGIRTHGDTKSIYARTFQTPSLARMDGGLFAPSSVPESLHKKMYFSEKPRLGDALVVLTEALQCNQNELRCLVKAADAQDENQPLTMALLGRLYRHNLARQMLRVTSSEYLDLLSVLPTSFDLFKSPRTTLEFVQAWQQLQDGNWSSADILSSLKFMKGGSNGAEKLGDAKGQLCLSSAVVESFDLGVDEIKYIASSSSAYVELNNSAPSLANLTVLESYRNFRDSLNNDPQKGLMELLNWVGSPTGDLTIAALCSRLSAATGWRESEIAVALEQKYPRIPVTDIIARFSSIDELRSLQAVVTFPRRIDLKPSPRFSPQALTLALYQIATPLPPVKTDGKLFDREAKAEASLRACFGDSPVLDECTRDVHEAGRNALVAFLLQQSHVREQGISNVSELFAHFLIDEQIDAHQETTRVKAAISSVQMFVQSCVLGLGPRAVRARVDPSKWAEMGRYSVWKAKRLTKPADFDVSSLRDG